MADIRIDNQGFCIGRWDFPPFKLRCGECVTLCLPKEAPSEEERIVACLTGMELVPGLNVHTKVLFAKPASIPSGWRRWIRNPTPFTWLQKNTTLSDDAIGSFLHEYKMDRNIPLSHLAGNPRMLLGLKAAYAREPEVVVFSTQGLDPMGVREAFRMVNNHLPQCSAIYLAWPFFCQGQELHDFFPGSIGVTVIDNHLPTFAH